MGVGAKDKNVLRPDHTRSVWTDRREDCRSSHWRQVGVLGRAHAVAKVRKGDEMLIQDCEFRGGESESGSI